MRTETISILNGQLNPKSSNGGSTNQLFTVDPTSLGFDHLLKQHTADAQSKASGPMSPGSTHTLEKEASRPRPSGNDLPRETRSSRSHWASGGDDRTDVRRRQDSNVEARKSQQNDSSPRSAKSDDSTKPSDGHQGCDQTDRSDQTCDNKQSASTDQDKPGQGKENAEVAGVNNDPVNEDSEVSESSITDGVEEFVALSDGDITPMQEGGADAAMQSDPLASSIENLGDGALQLEGSDHGGEGLVAEDAALSATIQSDLKPSGEENLDDNNAITEASDAVNVPQFSIEDAVTDGEQVDGQIITSDDSTSQVNVNNLSENRVDQSQAQAQIAASVSPELEGQAQMGGAEDASELGAQARRATLQPGTVNPSTSSEAVKTTGQGNQDQSQAGSDNQGFEQKFELPISGKLQTKANPTDGVAFNTPVQERLAALARSLDQGGAEKLDSSNGGKTTALDAIKSLASQRGGEAPTATQGTTTSRSLGTVQTPLPTTFQGAMQAREWASELGQKLMMMVGSKIQSAQIQLNPRDMGPIDVKVVMQQEQAHVMFSSQVANTREALEQALPRLREMFDQNGVGLADVDVRDQSAEHSQQEGSQLAQDGQSWQSDDSAGDDAVQSEVTISQGIVDYYA